MATPTTEIGTALPSWSQMAAGQKSAMMDTEEYVVDLQFPSSPDLYKQMRNDSQIFALYAGCTLPIRNYTWHLTANGADPKIVEELAADLNIAIAGQPITTEGRRQKRFSFGDHLRHALLAIIYGFVFFEQVGEIDESNKWRLRKLGERLPATISEINIEADGGLAGIMQTTAAGNKDIPVDRLVAYVWDKEGSNWFGRSMLRPLYKNWLIKDRLLRVDAINHERAGAGVPVATAPEGATDAQIATLSALAQSYVSGEHSGAALPYGADLKLKGVEGQQPATLNSIRYHDESMARGFLAMFMQLGQTETGSRALGETFVDFMSLGQQAVAKWFRDIFNEHVVEDWVDWNYGEGVAAPRLDFVVNSDKALSVAELISLSDAQILTVDDEIKSFIRQDYGLPDQVDNTTAATAGGLAASRRKRTVAASTSSEVSLPDRPLRRQPYETEVLAKTDFKKLDEEWEAATVGLVAKVKANQPELVDELEQQILDAGGDVEKLAALNVAGNSEAEINAALQDMLGKGVDGAMAEAKSQGAKLNPPDLDASEARLASRATATDSLIARALGESASRKAVYLSGGGLDSAGVASAVRDHLESLSDAFLNRQLGGALTGAQNEGRREVMRDDAERVEASELLDTNTCPPCSEKDGTQYDTIEEAEADYPTGGYIDCEGGDSCRGTLVAVYRGENEATK